MLKALRSTTIPKPPKTQQDLPQQKDPYKIDLSKLPVLKSEQHTRKNPPKQLGPMPKPGKETTVKVGNFKLTKRQSELLKMYKKSKFKKSNLNKLQLK